MKGKRIAIGTGAVALVVVVLTAWLAWPRIHFWSLFEPFGRNPQGYLEYRHRQTGIVFVRLPGGTFWMGAQKDDPNGKNYDPDAEDDEGPVHEVMLAPLLIGKREVTQAEWKAVMGSNPSSFTSDEDRPVEGVSWDDIQEFEAKTGLALPTEAQWEYACRAGKPMPKLEELAWFDGNSGNTTHPVGTKDPNAFGLHDILGNVWEWCEDAYNSDFYSKLEASMDDSFCSSPSGDRVLRGGSWFQPPVVCRASSRHRFPPVGRNQDVGFRPALRWPH